MIMRIKPQKRIKSSEPDSHRRFFAPIDTHSRLIHLVGNAIPLFYHLSLVNFCKGLLT